MPSTITAQSIVDKTSIALQDVDAARRWSASELLAHLNDGLRETERIAPHLVSTSGEVALVAGAFQSLPATFGRILNSHILPMLNKGVGGGVAGNAITQIEESDLALYDPGWQTTTAVADAIHFMLNKSMPYNFKLYPPQPAPPSTVEVAYSVIPTDISLATVIPVRDRHANALRDYCVYRALAAEGEIQDEAKAAAYLQLFESGIKG